MHTDDNEICQLDLPPLTNLEHTFNVSGYNPMPHRADLGSNFFDEARIQEVDFSTSPSMLDPNSGYSPTDADLSALGIDMSSASALDQLLGSVDTAFLMGGYGDMPNEYV